MINRIIESVQHNKEMPNQMLNAVADLPSLLVLLMHQCLAKLANYKIAHAFIGPGTQVTRNARQYANIKRTLLNTVIQPSVVCVKACDLTAIY